MAVLRPRKPLSGKASTTRRVAGMGSRSLVRLPLKSFPGRWWKNLPKENRRRILYVAAAVVLFGLLSMVGVVAWVSQDLPDPNKLSDRSVAQSTKIYARDGTTLLYEVHGEQRRTLIELDEIGEYTKAATLSIEDKDFYNHGGISLRGTLRAIFVDLSSGTKAQGGSTITQQLVKNAILTNEKSVIRKVKEWILSYQIERRFTKDQILKLYFNEIPYGANAYGVEAAAQSFFNKRARDLDLAESALLASVLPAPSYYSPRGNHPDELLARWKRVLDAMVDEKYITRTQAEEAKKIDILSRISPTRDRILAPHFVFFVRDYLEEKYGVAQLERGGLSVVTTLDPILQNIAEEEVRAGVERIEERYRASNGSLVAIEPRSGQLLAMVGSRDYFDSEHDGNFNVSTSVRNPGSSFKPIVYLSAFMKGYTPETVLFDLTTNFGPDGSGKDFVPKNYDLVEHGPLQMRNTLAGSLNIPAVKTLYLAGIPSTIDVAEKLGYTTFDRDQLGLALAIGGGGVRLIEHVSAFATLANDGVRNPTTAILRVEDSRGKVLELFENNQDPERVLPEEPVRQLVDVLSDNGARAFVFGSQNRLTLPGRSVAAKTGTTNDFIDAWTMGFTPQVAAGVWVGNNDNSEMRSGADGSIVAAPIWNAFMRRALENTPAANFPRPKALTTTKPVLRSQVGAETKIVVDSETGKRVPDSCVEQWPDQYARSRVVKDVHNILHYVQRDDPQGDAPNNPESDPMYSRWETPVQEWAKKNGYLTSLPAEERCSLRVGNSSLGIEITSPASGATITSASVSVVVSVVATEGVSSVRYLIDGKAVATASAAPYNTTLDLSGVGNGFHTLGVELTDADKQTTTDVITINVLKNESSASYYFITPSSGDEFFASEFPIPVRVFSYDPSGVSTITLYEKKSDGAAVVLDSVSNPTANSVEFVWDSAAKGEHQIYFVSKGSSGAANQSDLLTITVK